MYDIITIGSATRDVFLKSEGFELRRHEDSPTGMEQCFPLGTKIEVKKVVFTTGGGGTNTAVTFSRQGLKTGCVSIIGKDFNGQEIIKEMKEEGVEPFFTIHDDDFTAYSTILVYPNAERTILSYKGEGQHFDPDEIEWGKLKTQWVYLDSLGGSWDLFIRAFEHAKENGAKVAFNPGGKELAHGLEKLKPYLAKTDIFILNEEEGESLLKMPQKSKAGEVLEGLDKLVKGVVVLTLGPQGVLVSDKKSVFRAKTPDSPKVERTGAGDAFGSGFVAQYILSGGDIVKSIQFATANASSVVSQYGPKAGILRKGDWGPWELVKVDVSHL